MMWWSSGYGWLWMLLTWVVLIGLGVWVVALLSGRDASSGRGRSSAHRILDERFARGEIDEEEYRRRRDELER